MGNKLYVGNLPYSVRDEDLQQSFGQFGAVTSAKVMMERDTRSGQRCEAACIRRAEQRWGWRPQRAAAGPAGYGCLPPPNAEG